MEQLRTVFSFLREKWQGEDDDMNMSIISPRMSAIETRMVAYMQLHAPVELDSCGNARYSIISLEKAWDDCSQIN